jgi:hypothetical protein
MQEGQNDDSQAKVKSTLRKAFFPSAISSTTNLPSSHPAIKTDTVCLCRTGDRSKQQ